MNIILLNCYYNSKGNVMVFRQKVAINNAEGSQNADVAAIAEKINTLMSENKISTKILSEATDISIAAINNLKRGEGNPTIGTLNAICRFFNVPLIELLGLDSLNQTQKQVIAVPLYELRLAHIKNKENIETTTLIEIPKNSGAKSLFGIVVNNNSFLPFYDKGTIFILTPTKSAVDSDIVFVRIQSNINAIKRIFIKKDNFYLKNIGLDETIEPYKKNEIEIQGIVTQIIQKTA